jgi:hypothetical protein
MAISDTDRKRHDLRRRSYAAMAGLDSALLLLVLAGIGAWRDWPIFGVVMLAVGGFSILLKEVITYSRTGFFGFISPIFEESEQTKELKRIASEHRANNP